jgi:hypothetical protein
MREHAAPREVHRRVLDRVGRGDQRADRRARDGARAIEQVADQPRLADAGLALDEHREALPAAVQPVDPGREPRALAVAADHRRPGAQPAPAGTRVDAGAAGKREQRQRHELALERHRAERLEPEPAAATGRDPLADQDLAGRRLAHQPRGDVGLVAEHAVGAAPRAAIRAGAHPARADADLRAVDERERVGWRAQLERR